MLFLTTNLLCVIKLLTVPERKRDMKTIIKDLFIICTMMVGLIGVAAFCLFAPPIPLWVTLPIITVWTLWIVKGVIECR